MTFDSHKQRCISLFVISSKSRKHCVSWSFTTVLYYRVDHFPLRNHTSLQTLTISQQTMPSASIESKIVTAIEAIKGDNNLSIRAAAKTYDPYTTLQTESADDARQDTRQLSEIERAGKGEYSSIHSQFGTAMIPAQAGGCGRSGKCSAAGARRGTHQKALGIQVCKTNAEPLNAF